MEGVAPLLANSEFGLELSKWLNAAQILTSRLNDRLKDISQNQVSLETLLGETPQLRAYLQMAFNLPVAAIDTLLKYVSMR